MFSELDMYYVDPARPLTTAGEQPDDLDHDLSDLSNLSEVCISWRTFVKPNPKHDACGPANSVGCTRDGKYLCCICVEDCFHNENVVLYPII